MPVPKGKNNFATHQNEVVEGNAKLIEAELKSIRGRAGVSFEDLDSLVRYVAKVTGIHRTTLKRNARYRRQLREYLARQTGSTALVKVDEATPELLRAIVEERDLTISNLTNQVQVLKTRLSRFDEKKALELAAPSPAPVSASASGIDEAAFQDTAIALLQLIQHINRTAGVETLVIDEESGLIMDTAIVNPRKRREMAIGPERTKAFIRWYKANKSQF